AAAAGPDRGNPVGQRPGARPCGRAPTRLGRVLPSWPTFEMVPRGHCFAFNRGGGMKRGILVAVGAACLIATVAVLAATGAKTTVGAAVPRTVGEYQSISGGATPPTQAACAAIAGRCFTPQAMRAAYNIPPLYQQGYDGRGQTIAIMDSFGNDNMAND